MNEQEMAREAEIIMLQTELLAKELILGAMLVKLGGKTTITPEDMQNLKFMIGNAEEILNNNDGYVASRIVNEQTKSVTYELIVKKIEESEKVM